jgi:iron complex outermembrane receptor protein
MTVVLWTMLLAAASLSAADGSMTGKLTDPQGKPVTGAKLRLSNGRETISDQEGAFSFPAILPGTYKLVATEPGFIEITHTITVADGVPTAIALQLIP